MSPTVRAALWMLGAIFSFTLMAVAGREVSDVHDTFEIMFFRSLVGIAIVVGLARYFGKMSEVSTDRLGLHLIRNVCHFTGQNLWFFALTAIPLAQLFALEFTSPLWVLLLAPLFLGERLTAVKLACAALGFLGVLIAVRPEVSNINVGMIAGAISAIGFAGSAIFTRLLTRHESITSILFWLTVMQAVFGLVCAGYDLDITLPTAATAPWIFAIGCAGLLAHFCLTTALSLAPAGIVMPIDFARLPIIAILGFALYAEPIEATVLIGGALIVLANAINLRTESRLAAKK